MRGSYVRIVCAALSLAPILGAAACASSPAITVVRTKSGGNANEILGDSVKLKRVTQEDFAGARTGFFVVRTLEDWQRAWPGDKGPALPRSLDTSTQMLFFAVSESDDVTAVKVERAVETAGMVHVWVRETKTGDACVNKATERAFDAVVATRVEKPVTFHVDQELEESCGAPPTAGVECRIENQPTWATKLEAQPADTVECALSATERGKFALVDKLLTMGELPPGSSAKLAFNKGPERGQFDIDVYGAYTVNAEAADEAGRRGKGSATIEVKPPKTKDVLVQLVWAGFDRKDESDTFPRVNLRVAEEGPRGQRCSAEIPVPGLCEVKTRGAYTYMRIPAGNRKLPVSVQFMDERAEQGPGPCVHVWYDGARTGEVCDRKHRSTDEVWKVGVLDTGSGALTVDGAPTPRAPHGPVTLEDGGAFPTDAGGKTQR